MGTCGTCAWRDADGTCVLWAGDATEPVLMDFGIPERLASVEAWVEEVRVSVGWVPGAELPAGPVGRACPEFRERTVSGGVTV
jgi:hypothetical protein